MLAARVSLLRASAVAHRRFAHALTTPRHDPFPDVEKFPADLRATPRFAGSPKGHAEPYLADASKSGQIPEGSLPGMHSNTTANFLKNAMAHKELWPLFACMGFWAVLFSWTVYWNFSKPDIWIDRSKKLPPWDWERERERYYKENTLWFDPYGESHKRIPIMETLQDEMLDAARQRGTR